MKRSASAPRSYLQQLAAPLPPRSALLHARRPAARGAGTVLNAIPAIVDSADADPVDAPAVAGRSAAHAVVSPQATGDGSARSMSKQALSGGAPEASVGGGSAGDAAAVRSELASLSSAMTANSVPRRLAAASGSAEEVPQAGLARGKRSDASAPTYEGGSKVYPRSRTESVPQLSTQSQADAAPRPASVSLRSTLAEPAQPLASPSPMQHPVEFNRAHDQSAGGQSGRGVHVHIGTVEVRIAAPAAGPPPPVATHRRDTLPSQIGRPAQAEPLSRGLAWSHGLVQG